VGVHRGTGQDLRVDDSLPNTPVVIQQVPEVGDVEPELSRVLEAKDAVEQILNDAQVDAVDDGIEHGASLGVLATVRAEVGIVLDVLLEGCSLFGGRVRLSTYREGLEVHLRCAARDVNQVVAARTVSVR